MNTVLSLPFILLPTLFATLRAASLRLVICLALACIATASLAQPGGGMGGPGGGMGGPGGRPGGMPPGMAQAMKPPKLEDMLPPDSWELWSRKMQEARSQLQASAPEWAAYDALMKSLDQLSKSNERQLWRLLGKTRGTASAVPDTARDLRNSAEDLRDHLAALEDLQKAFEAFQAQAGEPLRNSVQGLYAQALREAQNGPRRAPQAPPR